ncbi:Sodium:neurotransmitter symporter [Cinara cedri]|uniref:Sodium:neurotransmitter symporter n=1 Tax=Cinara cedri TaxID=506608 RepID=A0A5E4MRR3_9HEMI|nr:Sodium:neurotransmitter symporter [Cinara cedri]
MISIDENQGPESYFDQMSSSRSASFSYSEDDILTFKLYENVNSRPLPEEELRSKFSGYVDYLLYCFSLTGSLANLTRFPFVFSTVFNSSRADRYSVVFYGNGSGTVLGQRTYCTRPIQSRCLLYMYWSLSEPQLPWKICGFVNNTSQCIDERKHFTKNGTKSVGIELCVPMENFYLNEIVQMDKSVLYNGLGNVNVPLLGCLAVSWIINFSLLNATSNLMKYIQIFGSIIPFPFLFIMLFIIMTDKDAWDGFYTLFDPSTIDFLDLQSWRRAAEQVLYSLDVGTGHLIIYGKNCNFRDNILSSILSVALLDIICAVAASLIIFGTANILAYKFHITFQSVFISGI